MRKKFIEIYRGFSPIIVFSVLFLFALFGYWFLKNFKNGYFNRPENMPALALLPPSLTTDEKARIQESINAEAGKNLLSGKELNKILKTLTSPEF